MVLAPLPYEMRVNILMRGTLRMLSNCAADPAAVILAFASAGETDWTAHDCLVWVFYDFEEATIVSVLKRQAKSLNWELREDLLPGIVHAKVAPHCFDKFRDGGMSRENAKVVWACYKADGTDLRETPSLAAQPAFVQNMNDEPSGSVSEGRMARRTDWTLEMWSLPKKPPRLVLGEVAGGAACL